MSDGFPPAGDNTPDAKPEANERFIPHVNTSILQGEIITEIDWMEHPLNPYGIIQSTKQANSEVKKLNHGTTRSAHFILNLSQITSLGKPMAAGILSEMPNMRNYQNVIAIVPTNMIVRTVIPTIARVFRVDMSIVESKEEALNLILGSKES